MSTLQRNVLLRITTLLIVLALIASMPPLAAAETSRIHPSLIALAAAHAHQTVDVIVQKAAADNRAEALVGRLGGRVTKDLRLIRAFAARMPAYSAMILAQHPAVRWISPDASVINSQANEGWRCTGNYGVEVVHPNSGIYNLRLAPSSSSARCEQDIATTPNTAYTLSAYVLTASGASLAFGVQGINTTQTSSSSFAEKQLRFTTSATQTSVTIFFETVGALGQAYIDDVALTPTPTPPSANSPLKLQYRLGDQQLLGTHIVPHIMLVNTGTDVVPLGELTLRYWYTAEKLQQQQFWCDWASFKCQSGSGQPNVTGRFVPLSRPVNGADYYLEIRFAGTAGSIGAKSQKELHGRFAKSDWSNYNEADDYSFHSLSTTYRDWSRVTLYRNNQLVWGTEPGNIVFNPGFESGNTTINAYRQAIASDQLQQLRPELKGQGITVAVIDSGITENSDLAGRVLASVKFGNETETPLDEYGHGTHVAGIIAGSGMLSNGAVSGVAPSVNLVNVKFGDGNGSGRVSDLIRSLQWVYENKDSVNPRIRVVNLSLNSTSDESYRINPLNAAVEMLWFSGLVVIVSTGNNRDGKIYSPANDPFVISVGATYDQRTADIEDDQLASYSAYGSTPDGYVKPDILAPGSQIISLLASNSAVVARQHPDHLPSGFVGAHGYFRMSGTSMAAAVVSGAVALLLQDEPNLTPDQVKYRLMATARPLMVPGIGPLKHLQILSAVQGNTTHQANLGIPISRLIETEATWDGITWSGRTWTSVDWSGRTWTSTCWSGRTWTSVDWAN